MSAQTVLTEQVTIATEIALMGLLPDTKKLRVAYAPGTFSPPPISKETAS